MTANAERCESYRGMSWLSYRYVCSRSNILSQLIESSGSPVHLTVIASGLYITTEIHSVILFETCIIILLVNYITNFRTKKWKEMKKSYGVAVSAGVSIGAWREGEGVRGVVNAVT